jgi:DNA-directed RNA polymerase I subunit RPA2
MAPFQSGFFKFQTQKSLKKSKTYYYEVILNGKLVGYVESNEIEEMKKKLRYLKALATNSTQQEIKENPLIQGLSKYMEICHLPKVDLENCNYNLYPALYIFTTPGRMMRPVKNLLTNGNEYIGTMEQCYLHVCCSPEEFVENVIVEPNLKKINFVNLKSFLH